MRPLSEQTILVTGATDGHGQALATELAALGATVLVHGRDDRRGARTMENIASQAPEATLDWYRADFSSLAEVAELADRVSRDHERLDALVNNAGIGTTTEGRTRRELSRDHYEMRFAVNYLAGFLLTRRLLPTLERASPARIVNVASIGQAPIAFDDVMLERGYDGYRAYAQSKLAQIMFTLDLATELKARGITANCLHPATYMETKIVRADGNTPTSTIAEGLQATLQLLADPHLDGVTGHYYNTLQKAEPHPQASDPKARRRLRDLSEHLIATHTQV